MIIISRGPRNRTVSEVLKLVGFILIAIGTIGLLVNEFVLDWGRAATLILAVFNCVGLASLAFVNWGKKK